MLTIKICESDQTERLYEAVSVEKVMDAHTAPDIGQIRVLRADGGEMSYPIFSEPNGRSVFVMNRFGATVANYRI